MKAIHSNEAPKAVGAYSQAIATGNLIFLSGQLPFDPKTSQIVGAEIAEQTEQVLNNLESVLKAAGLDRTAIVKTTILITNLKRDFKIANQVYADFFGSHKPARAAFEVSGLYQNALIEIEAIAVKE